MAERYIVTIAPGRNDDYLNCVQAVLGVAKESGNRRAAGQIVFGANAGAFVFNTYDDSWADLEKRRPPQRAMSASELAAFQKWRRGRSRSSAATS